MPRIFTALQNASCAIFSQNETDEKQATESVVTELMYDRAGAIRSNLVTSGLSPSQLEREEIMDIKVQERDVRIQNWEMFIGV